MGKRTQKSVPAGLQGIVIKQSNKVTNAKYNYSLYAERVFTWIMYHLQTYVKQVMDGKQVTQLDLFKQESDTYLIDIPLSSLARPDNYDQVREACEGMTTIPIVMQDEKNETRKVASLLAAVTTQLQGKQRSNTVRIEMRADVIKLLIHVDTNNRFQPARFTQYMLHVALLAKSKYTVRLYKFLCSWKAKGGCTVSVEELREILQVKEGAYKNFNDFKRYILLPAQKEMKEIADIWFNCSDPEFEMHQDNSKKVWGVRFKIIEPVSEELLTKRIDHIFYTLKTMFGFLQTHCEQIRPVLHSDTNWEVLRNIMDRCYFYAQENKVNYKPAFVVKSILNELAPL